MREAIIETRNIRFEGNNYSEEWVREAERRGLPNLKKAPEAIEQLLQPSAKNLFTTHKVLSEAELHSRHHVMLERYVKKLTIEAETLSSMVDTYIVPAAVKEQHLLATSIRSVTEVSRSADVSEQTARLNFVTSTISELLIRRKELVALLSRVNSLASESERAHLLSNEVLSLMGTIRTASDKLEDVVSDEFWPLPKYREMLFLA